MVNGTIFENLKYGQLLSPQALSTATTYNGSAVSTTGNGLDTLEFDELVVLVNTSDVDATSTIDVSLYHSNTDDPATASLIALPTAAGVSTNASFTQVTNDSAQQMIGFVKTKASKRYIWAKQVASISNSCYASIDYILGKSDTLPVSQSAEFEIGF
jgi:hypothetical protein